MANMEHLAQVMQGVDAWNAWRITNDEIRPDLEGSDLRGADLHGADLHWAHLDRSNLRRVLLDGADLSWADLREADLGKADLAGADLAGAHLEGANLRGANLDGADLHGAYLDGADLAIADLSGANLNGTNLQGANIGWTIFGDVDLRTVYGLETLRHEGPSTIGINALYRSRGQIPEAFLRGAGVPDDFITYIKSLVGSPFEYYSCFISYSSMDQEFAEYLHADLQNKGVRCWFAPHDVQGGQKLHEQIDQAIRIHERLLLILSHHSMRSEWVKTEIAKARQREVREQRKVFFPVRLVSFEAIRDWECFDADTGKDSAREIREYFIPDFSNWQNYNAYHAEFQRLLRDLKANSTLL